MWSLLQCLLVNLALYKNKTHGFTTKSSPIVAPHITLQKCPKHANKNAFLGGSRLYHRYTTSKLLASPNDNADHKSPVQTLISTVTLNPERSVYFSLLMTLCGASLGPFLDSYHSLFGVLTYDTPFVFPLLGTSSVSGPALLTCVTTYWVPPLFGLAGFLIGWLYILLDAVTVSERINNQLHPTVPKALIGISYFTFQYWLSGILYAHGVDRSVILALMSALAAGGFILLDGTLSGLITSAATALGGPLIEVGLISSLPEPWGYHYNDSGETGYFPLWIIPVYFLGGPANGNLARSFWNTLGGKEGNEVTSPERTYKIIPCVECNTTRLVPCPNCHLGTYVTYNQRVVCKACRGKGRVICRRCFSEYGDVDPNDIYSIRVLVDELITAETPFQ
jgi:hypothetical protein